MITSLPTVLVTTLMFGASLLSPAPRTSPYVFTQYISEDNFVMHMTKKGDTLSGLAQIFYGSEDYWKNIWNDNSQIDDADALPDGAILKINKNKPEEIAKLSPVLQEKYDVKKFQNLSVYIPTSAPSPLPPTSVPSVDSKGAGQYDDVYKAAGEKFGVPWQILYGLHMTETGGRDGAIMSGYGSGAQGPMQFMPGTWKAYEVDGNGDGFADINNAVDAIYTAANFLARHGSLDAGLRSYGGNTSGTLALARQRGFE